MNKTISCLLLLITYLGVNGYAYGAKCKVYFSQEKSYFRYNDLLVDAEYIQESEERPFSKGSLKNLIDDLNLRSAISEQLKNGYNCQEVKSKDEATLVVSSLKHGCEGGYDSLEQSYLKFCRFSFVTAKFEDVKSDHITTILGEHIGTLKINTSIDFALDDFKQKLKDANIFKEVAPISIRRRSCIVFFEPKEQFIEDPGFTRSYREEIQTMPRKDWEKWHHKLKERLKSVLKGMYNCSFTENENKANIIISNFSIGCNYKEKSSTRKFMKHCEYAYAGVDFYDVNDEILQGIVGQDIDTFSIPANLNKAIEDLIERISQSKLLKIPSDS